MKTNQEEFKKWYHQLMRNAPREYTPWLFPVKRERKDPDGYAIFLRAGEILPEDRAFIEREIEKIKKNRKNFTEKEIYDKAVKSWKCSWKSFHARMTYEEAVEHLKKGNNIGIAARKNDCLHIIDIDDYYKVHLIPVGVLTLSRSRFGMHNFSWMLCDDKKNIPTEHGEIRSVDQYVLAPGSYVPTPESDVQKEVDDKKLPKEKYEEILKDPLLGCYTLTEKSQNSKFIRQKEIPGFFKEAAIKIEKNDKKVANLKKNEVKIKSSGSSALFDLKMVDLVSTKEGTREGHPLHHSLTGANWSISDDGCLGNCWRHNVTLNPIQFLCVKAGYVSCEDGGTGHGGTNSSCLIGDDKAIWVAWNEAKKMGLLPKGDKIPSSAIRYIAKREKLIESNYGNKQLPRHIFIKVIKMLEEDKF